MRKEIFLYTLSNTIYKAAAFLSFPILTKFLPISDFGKWSLMLVFSNLLVPLVSLNGSAGVLRESVNNYQNGFRISLIHITICTIFFFLNLTLNKIFTLPSWAYYAVLTSCAEAALSIVLTFSRARGWAIFYFFTSSLKGFSVFILAALALKEHMSIGDLFFYNLVVSMVFFVVGFFYFLLLTILRENAFPITENVKQYYPVVLFSILLIPHGLSQWIISSSDRIIIEHIVNIEAVGLYSIAYNLAMVLFILNSAIYLALPPLLIKNYNKWTTSNSDQKFIKYYTLAAEFLLAAICFALFVDKKYFLLIAHYDQDVIAIFIIVYFSAFLMGLYYFFANYLFYHRMAATISRVTFESAALSILLTFSMVSIFGLIGAAFSTLISYGYYLLRARHESIKVDANISIRLFKPIVSFGLFCLTAWVALFYAL